MEEKLIGKITHYFDKINVAIIKLSAPLKAGDQIRLKGNGIDFTQTVSSMQINHESIEAAKKGDEVGLKVDQKIRENDEVYLVIE